MFSRMLTAACLGLAATAAAQAADPAAFSVLVNNTDGKPMMFQSSAALKKGDVLKIGSFNAEPVMILQIAMCDSDCPTMHLVKTVPLTPYWRNVAHVNQYFVVPEDGHVSFWVQRVGGIANIPVTTRNHVAYLEVVDPLLGFSSPRLYPQTPPMAVSSVQLDDRTLLARFYHRTFVTVSLADAR